MNETIIKEVEQIKEHIPPQTYRTLMGQIRCGDIGGATVGLERLKKRLRREGTIYENRSRK